MIQNEYASDHQSPTFFIIIPEGGENVQQRNIWNRREERLRRMRQREMQEIEEKTIMEYSVPRKTDYGKYTVNVRVYTRFERDEEVRRVELSLYDREPVKHFLLIFATRKEPLMPPWDGDYTLNVDAAIEKMIADYEIPFHQKAKAERAREELNIDYEAEIARHTGKAIEIEKEESDDETFITVNDQGTEYLLGKNGMTVEIPEGKSARSYQNLKNLRDYQHMKRVK